MIQTRFSRNRLEEEKEVPSSNVDMMKMLEVIAETCEQAAAGDMEARIPYYSVDGPLKRTMDAINHLLDISDCYVRETAAAMDLCGKEQFHRPILLRGLPGAFRKSARIINESAITMKRNSEEVRNFEEARQRIAQRVEESAAHIARTVEAFEKSSTVLAEVASRGDDLSERVSSAADEASQSVHSVAAACEELVSVTSEISRQTSDSSDRAKSLVGEAQQAMEQFGKMNEAADQISSVVSFIDNIANQTNLLALNATIEAARAGEAGKGFAVVASEVKELSRSTGNATGKITKLIEDLQRTSGQAQHAIQSVNDLIRDIDSSVTAVSMSLQEQTTATRDISRSISEASQGTTFIADSMKDVSANARETEGIASEIRGSSSELAEESRNLLSEVEQLNIK